MIMSLRARIFIVVSLLLLVVLGISLGLLARQRSREKAAVTADSETSSAPLDTTSPGVSSPTPGAPVTKIVAPAELSKEARLTAEKQGVVNFARVFLERYQTYSTDNNWQNIREIETMVTPALWSRLSKAIGSPQSGEFVGVTTAALGGNLIDWADGKATVAVRVIRTTEKSGAVNRVNQEATVQLVKVSGAWLVDSFVWQ